MQYICVGLNLHPVAHPQYLVSPFRHPPGIVDRGLQILFCLGIGGDFRQRTGNLFYVFAGNGQILGHYRYVPSRLPIGINAGHQAFHMGHGLIHTDAHLVELGNHIVHFRLVFFSGVCHYLRKCVQVIADIPGVDKAVPHGFLDFFIPKYIIKGVCYAFQFFQNFSGTGHKVIDIPPGLARQGTVRSQVNAAVFFRRPHIYKFFTHDAIGTDREFRFLRDLNPFVHMHGYNNLVRLHSC